MDSALGLPAAPDDESSYDIRRQLVFDERDAVAQQELALFQALNLEYVSPGRRLERRNRSVEVAVRLLQTRKLRPKLAFFLLRHRCLGSRGPGVDFLNKVLKGGLWARSSTLSYYGLSRFGGYPTSLSHCGAQRGFSPAAKESIFAGGWLRVGLQVRGPKAF
jgi:hypothetical protein